MDLGDGEARGALFALARRRRVRRAALPYRAALESAEARVANLTRHLCGTRAWASSRGRRHVGGVVRGGWGRVVRACKQCGTGHMRVAWAQAVWLGACVSGMRRGLGSDGVG
eukprot:1114585-Prymnesium_polylepis.1